MNFKKITTLLLAGIVSLSLAGCVSDPVNQKEETDDSGNGNTGETKYMLFWEDEFEGETLNEEYWTHQLGNGSSEGIAGWGNNEKQLYRPENTTLTDGIMTIQATKDEDGKIYSSRIITRDKLEFTYGRIEAKMKLPVGQGFWPAFWMLPARDTPYGTWAASGEIDIMEARGRQPDRVGGALHYGGNWPNNTYQNKDYFFDENTSIADWHVYALEWEEGEIRWYCDDELYFTMNNWFTGAGEFPAPFDTDFYILFNLAVGGTFDGNRMPEDSDYPGVMQVDYVRVYTME